MTDSISRLKLAYMVATPDIESREALGYHGDINYSTKLLRERGYDGIELTTPILMPSDGGRCRPPSKQPGWMCP